MHLARLFFLDANTALYYHFDHTDITGLVLALLLTEQVEVHHAHETVPPDYNVCELALLTLAACRRPATWPNPAARKIGFVTANGVRLQYLDWGGSGPALILIHGSGDNPHAFDDLVPAFTDRFRVIAYAQRGHGNSEVKGPCDTSTTTEDIRAFMDSLGIAKANLAGWSMGGNIITAMAGTHPQRIDHLVYLDGAYDWSDPAPVAAL